MSKIHTLFDDGIDRTLPAGQLLLYQGDSPTETYFIREGYVKMYDITAEGNEKLLCLLGPGTIFPILWPHHDDFKVKYFYESFTPTLVVKKERKLLIKAVEADHQLTLEALRIVTQQTEDLLHRLECIQLSNAAKKIALVLQYLHEAHGTAEGNTSIIPIPLTHQVIADMAGVRRETVSLEIKELEKNGICKYLPERININLKKLGNFLLSE